MSETQPHISDMGIKDTAADFKADPRGVVARLRRAGWLPRYWRAVEARASAFPDSWPLIDVAIEVFHGPARPYLRDAGLIP
jgi:hypothetical protein